MGVAPWSAPSLTAPGAGPGTTMTSSRNFDTRNTLRKLFPTRWARAAAAESQALVRRRKADATVLFWTDVLQFDSARQRTLADLRRLCERAIGQHLDESSFYQRTNASFTGLLGQALRTHLARSVHVRITDSTVLRLHELLAENFQDLLPKLERDVLDVDIEVRVQRRRYRGHQRTLRWCFGW